MIAPWTEAIATSSSVIVEPSTLAILVAKIPLVAVNGGHLG